MTAATDTGANGGHGARAQHTDPSHTPVAERITVALIPKVASILRRLQNRKNLSKADIVNQAVTLYDFIDAQLDAGRDILVRDNVTQEIQSVMLL